MMKKFRKPALAFLLSATLLLSPLTAYANSGAEDTSTGGFPTNVDISSFAQGSGSGGSGDADHTPSPDPAPVASPMKNRPKIVIDSYKFDPNPVMAGSDFTLDLTFYNTNGVNSIRNMKVTLVNQEATQNSGAVFIPDETSNTFYARYIAPEGEVTKRIRMFVVPDAAQRTYTITANFEYEDADGNEYSTSENIGIPVVQRTELSMAALSIPSEAMMYQPTIVPLNFYNTGKTPLYNLMIKLDSPMRSDNPQMYVGNFASGSQETFEVNFTPEEPGEHSGKVVFSYEDAAGKEYTQEVPFKVNVTEGMDPSKDPGMMGMDEMPPEMMEPQPTPIWQNPILWVGLGAAALIAFVIIRRIKKKKQEEELEIHD